MKDEDNFWSGFIVGFFAGILFLIFAIWLNAPERANAAPVAGATYQIHVQNMRAPVAPWQQDILEVINEEPKERQHNKRRTTSNSGVTSSNRSGFTSISERHLTKQLGIFNGPSGRETYYNLPMGQVVRYMEDLGYNYRYSVREDGVKMLGPYVMCAADLSIRPKGTIVETSLGRAIVCDTGSFVQNDRYQLDIATSW